MITYLKSTMSQQDKMLKKYTKIVEKINQLEPEFESLTDEQLREKTKEFKSFLNNNGTIDDIKAEAFANSFGKSQKEYWECGILMSN